ncbi:hypothetical protein P9Z80_13840 [Bacillus cereus]|nr:hypothetical protein [Bacillus cereus]MEC3261975.1 hypothetical protein [Bacillus cereus]
MKTQMTFNIYSAQVKEFVKIVPETLRARTICKFFKKEYVCPDTFNTVFEGEAEVYQVRMDKVSANKLDEIVVKAKMAQIEVNRSIVMRDVFEQFISKYKECPLPKPVRKRTSLNVAAGTINELANYIEHYERNKTIEEFILEEYHGPYVSISVLKQKLGNEYELMPVTLDENAFSILGEIADEYGNGVKKSHILRDVINQLSQKYKDNKI